MQDKQYYMEQNDKQTAPGKLEAAAEEQEESEQDKLDRWRLQKCPLVFDLRLLDLLQFG